MINIVTISFQLYNAPFCAIVVFILINKIIFMNKEFAYANNCFHAYIFIVLQQTLIE